MLAIVQTDTGTVCGDVLFGLSSAEVVIKSEKIKLFGFENKFQFKCRPLLKQQSRPTEL